jgi:dihydrofolate synthase/folylpolyglutamate synthase
VTSIDTYEQAEAFLFGRINYERITAGQGDFKLDRMRELLRLLGDPQERIPVVHIAGTKGKGSTAAMTASILRAAGYRVGLYTSPHIARFEERMTVDGALPTAAQIVDLTRRVREATQQLDAHPDLGSPTFFEVVTATGWLHFESQQCDLVVLEVGLGGRLDSTNVCRPAACVITSISRDHTALLGTTLGSIAREKAGIIKAGVPVVCGTQGEESGNAIEDACRTNGASLCLLDRDVRLRIGSWITTDDAAAPVMPLVHRRIDIETPWRRHAELPIVLAGRHQARNAALAVTVCDVLNTRGWNIPADAVAAGLLHVDWPLRIEVVCRQPLVVLDAAHNWASAGALLATLDEEFAGKPRTLIFAATRDKDVIGLLRRLLPRFDRTILTQYISNPRVVPVEQLRDAALSLGASQTLTAESAEAAWNLALQLCGQDELICGTGSFFLAAELRGLLLSGRA